jgi:hypothetical protein
MAKNRKVTAEKLAAQEERSRRFHELLERRHARDQELKSAGRKADPPRK